MSDAAYKGRLEGLEIAFTYVRTEETVNEIVVLHDCDPVAAHLLGRSITAGIMAAALLPEDQRMNICWRYPGRLKTLVVDAGAEGSARGMCSPTLLQEAEDEQALFGDIGDIQVVISKKGRILHSGTTPVSLHDPVADFGYHLALSDQIETAMCATIAFQPDTAKPVKRSQGWMLQALPGCDLPLFERLRRRMEGADFRRVAIQMAEAEEGIAEVIQLLCAEEAAYRGMQVKQASTPHFSCTCSEEKMKAALRTIPIPERMQLVKAQESSRVRCQFCSRAFTFDIAACIAVWSSHQSEK
jgi:molecular chaperone Hsp33